jgi:parallel beta-helix repeat protein
MKRLLSIGVILLFIGMSISSSTGFTVREQTNIPISNGKTFYVGGSGPGNYTKIQDAIDDASDGDTVFVYNGTYYENLLIKKEISLIGEDKNITIINGLENNSVICIYWDSVTISEFTIQSSGLTEHWLDAGIEVDYYSCYVRISNNIVKKNPTGVLLFCTGWCNVTNNIITSNRYGFIGTGARMMGSCVKNTISHNIISNNTDYGIWCREKFQDNIISNNTIIYNTYGIEFECNCYENICYRNNISNNFVGLNSIPIGLYVTKNNFIDNKKHAKQYYQRNGCLWDEGAPNCKFDGNYWGKAIRFPYPIPTRHGLIFCFLPGFPLWDWHPAQEPYDLEV